MVAINHARAQILAPHREADPWAGLDRAGEASAVPPPGPLAEAPGGWDAPTVPDETIPVAGGNAEGWPDSDFERNG